MIVRKPKAEETDKLIHLLRDSLGESLLKKTAEIWNFKHRENPFGESYVLIAEENGESIGVRVFMQWRWQIQDKVWVSYRAVDTATHPNHQGKGIFTKLTLQAIKDVEMEEKSFVFNTPNEKSRPGYIKMGWYEVGKISVSLVPVFFYWFRMFGGNNIVTNSMSEDILESVCQKHNNHLKTENVLYTPKSASYLKWRFENNPMQEYIVISTSEWYSAMYVKKHTYFNELRVVETLGINNPATRKQFQKAVLKQALKNRCPMISIADKNLFSFRIFGSFGPKLTFRPMAQSNHLKDFALDIKNWKYSLGDLELF